MSTLSIHPVEYLKSHVCYDGIWVRLLTSLVQKVFKSSEQAATIVLLLLSVGLVIFSCMIIGESASIAANYHAAITEVLPPLQALPTVM